MTTSWVGGRQRHLLYCSNEPPLDLEIPSLRLLEHDLNEDLALLTEQISAAETRLEQLREQKKVVDSRKSALCGSLSPMRRLPAELLSEIFLWLQPHRSRMRPVFAPLNITTEPWPLMHVCRRWRSTASSTSALWSHLSIDMENYRYPVRFLEAHLERARELAIDFVGSSSAPMDQQQAVFDTLAQHSEKWVNISICLERSLFEQFNNLRGRLNAARRVWIWWENNNAVPPDISPMTCLDGAASLRDVGMTRWAESPTDVLVPNILLPVAQLTRYDFMLPWKMHLEMLTHTPNLIQARLLVPMNEQWGGGDRAVGRELRLETLQRLYVSHAGILDRIDTPDLVELAIEHYIPEDDEIPASAAALIKHCRCPPLKTVSICGEPTFHGIRTTLEKLPSIEELRIVWDDEIDDPFGHRSHIQNLLGYLHEFPLRAPALRGLSLAWETEVLADYEQLSQSLLSRRALAGNKLQVLEILEGKPPDVEFSLEGHPAKMRCSLRAAGFIVTTIEGPLALEILDGYKLA
ncbi:F-box domain-containing protein [Mycena chlorophos]|uniref:F-box domain-containing protein n=1 Tax=Mycena chlorophos TaxID=658473 RepID=A0A8H6TH18_MYCCL|nr:F-box domain-containing protein [Mycena chlorophos]